MISTELRYCTRRSVIAVALAGLIAIAAGQAPGGGRDVLTLDLARPGAPISPTMYGVFFEDINFGADGGL